MCDCCSAQGEQGLEEQKVLTGGQAERKILSMFSGGFGSCNCSSMTDIGIVLLVPEVWRDDRNGRSICMLRMPISQDNTF